MTLCTLVLSSDQIETAARFLLNGEIVAFPTETVYGLGAPIFYPESIAKIYQIKNRPVDNPLIAHISNLEQLKSIAIDIPQEVERLAAAFWPGPLTIVCKRHPNVPAIASAGLDTIAVRMPNHPVALALIERVGEPLVAPSANLSGKPSPTVAAHVIEDLANSIAAVIDGGSSLIGIESTVVNLLGKHPVILRPGAITELALQEVLQRPVEFYSCSDGRHEGEQLSSPGMKYRHYAPKAPLKLFFDREKLFDYLIAQTEKVLLLSNDICFSLLANGAHFPLCSKTLYCSLRYADSEHFEQVLAYCDKNIIKDRALMDRLTRASAVVCV